MTYKDERYYCMLVDRLNELNEEQVLATIESELDKQVGENILLDVGTDVVGNPYSSLYMRGILMGIYLSRAKLAYILADRQEIGLRDYFKMCFILPDMNNKEGG